MSAIMIGIATGIVGDVLTQPLIVMKAEAYNVEEVKPQEARLEVIINWTPERIEQEIRTTFPESPNTAVAIAKCESGMKPKQVGLSSPDYGLMQINGPSWDRKAALLGYTKYRTDVKDNLKMARHIYDAAGGKWTDWVCYTSGKYKAKL